MGDREGMATAGGGMPTYGEPSTGANSMGVCDDDFPPGKEFGVQGLDEDFEKNPMIARS
jgi:hypothetical protein